jgi:hypothetical protein
MTGGRWLAVGASIAALLLQRWNSNVTSRERPYGD